MTPSPIDCSVICALSFSRNSASSYSLRSVMSSSTPTRRSSRPCASTRALARLMTQRHSPLRWRMRCMLSKIGVLPATCSRIAVCTRARSSGCTRLRQSATRCRSVVVVAEHRLPARREVDLVALDVEVPQAVVGRGLRPGSVRSSSLLEARLDAHALEAGREAGAEQLHQQLQVDVPGAARQASAQARGSRPACPAMRKRHQQRRADVQLGKARGFRRLLLARAGAVAQLREAQVLEARRAARGRTRGSPRPAPRGGTARRRRVPCAPG